MSIPEILPSTARCRGCDYLLRDLPAPVCPECGRAFDPHDPTTYETRPPGWRRRQWMRRGAPVAGLLLLLWAFAPRGLLKGELTFTCSMCGQRTRFYRYELRPPRWIPWRYPGVAGSTSEFALPFAPTAGCSHPQHDVAVRFDFRIGSATGANKGATAFNGEVVSMETAGGVLDMLMSPEAFGISVDPVPSVLEVPMSPDATPIGP